MIHGLNYAVSQAEMSCLKADAFVSIDLKKEGMKLFARVL
jgi:hypothetical protein